MLNTPVAVPVVTPIVAVVGDKMIVVTPERLLRGFVMRCKSSVSAEMISHARTWVENGV
jgi:hypothetical protein